MPTTWRRATRAALALGVALGPALAMAAAAPPARADLTDEDVRRAIEKGKEYLINLQGADGSFAGGGGGNAGDISCLVYVTLAYMKVHPNPAVMQKGLDYIMGLSAEAGLSKPGYSLPMRTMALAYVYPELLSRRRAQLRLKMQEDILRFQVGQTKQGGWRYKLDGSSWDFSNSQWEILACREAALVDDG